MSNSQSSISQSPIHRLANKQAIVNLTTDMIAARILEDIETQNWASLMLSGGSTPGPVYDNLSKMDLPWDRITIGLVDDRWVDESDAGSNGALIRKTLLKNYASAAKFVPMKTTQKNARSANPFDCTDAVNVNYNDIPRPYSAVILGMGLDGHTASWFKGSDGYEALIDPSNTNLVGAITAKQTSVTGSYLNRMSLTRHGLSQSKLAILLVTGEDKIKVFKSATKNTLPISHASIALGNRLHVLACP